MDRKTYEALKWIMSFARKYGADEVLYEEFQTVLDWMSEVEKEVDD